MSVCACARSDKVPELLDECGDVVFFLTIFPSFLLCTFSWRAFVPLSGLMCMQALKINVKYMNVKYMDEGVIWSESLFFTTSWFITLWAWSYNWALKCQKKFILLNESQCTCSMLVLEVKVVVGGKEHRKPKKKRCSFTQDLLSDAEHPSMLYLCHWNRKKMTNNKSIIRYGKY